MGGDARVEAAGIEAEPSLCEVHEGQPEFMRQHDHNGALGHTHLIRAEVIASREPIISLRLLYHPVEWRAWLAPYKADPPMLGDRHGTFRRRGFRVSLSVRTRPEDPWPIAARRRMPPNSPAS